MSWSLVYQKYLQMQGRVNPVGITSFMTLMLNIGLNQLFIHTLDFGLRALIATTISRLANLILLGAYSASSSLAYETSENRKKEFEEWMHAKKNITKKMFQRGGVCLFTAA